MQPFQLCRFYKIITENSSYAALYTSLCTGQQDAYGPNIMQKGTKEEQLKGINNK